METSLKTGFAQIFSCCPKNLSCPKFGGAAAPLAPPGPYAYDWRNLSIELKYRQQSLAEYIFSQNTDFNYRRVPGIAWNIHGNFLPSLAFILFACKNVASTRNRISVGFKFSTSHFVDGRVFFWFSFLNFEGHTSVRGKKTIYRQKSRARLASGTGNPGWSRKRVYLLRSHQDSHQ